MNVALQMALDEVTSHSGFYEKADRYHEGTSAEKFANANMARLLTGSANRFRTNYARVPVTALCNRIKIAAIGIEGSDQGPAADFLDATWRDNGMENIYREVHSKAASAGTSYVLAWPDPSDPSGMSVDISMCDPETTRVFYDPENPRKIVMAARVWQEGKQVRANLYFADRIEKYVTKPRAGGKNAASFIEYVELEDENGDTVWPLPNPYGRVPIFHFRVSAGYGRPVNRDAWEPQDGVNKLTATMMSTIDFQGFPQRYALQHPQADEGVVADEWDAETTTSTGAITDEADTPKLKAGPGGMWFLNADDVGQFDAAEPDVFTKPIEMYVKAISTTTETPLHAFHGMGDAPSGESLRAANAPLNDNAHNVMGWFEPTWLDLMDYLLTLGGFTAKSYITWANVERADDTEFWTSIKTKIATGVPTRVALEEAGYSKEQQAAWVTDTDEALDVTDAELASKFEALGQAIRSGVEPEAAAASLGLKGLKFTGAVPVTLRQPVSDAAVLEPQ